MMTRLTSFCWKQVEELEALYLLLHSWMERNLEAMAYRQDARATSRFNMFILLILYRQLETLCI